MSRWIVFDQATANTVQSRCGIRPEVQVDERGEILQMALKSRAAVAVGPASQPGKVLLIRISRQERSQTSPTSKSASNLAPAGFLGLTDSIDMDTEPEPERLKKWWQKILD